MEFKRRVNVRGVIYRDGKLFAQQLKANNSNEAAQFWCTPGGGVEDGESILAALEREMVEETGVAPVIGRLLFVQQFHDGDKEQLEFFFHVTNSEDYEYIDLAAASHGELEIEQCMFIDPRREHILPAFLQTIDIAGHITGNQPVYISAE